MHAPRPAFDFAAVGDRTFSSSMEVQASSVEHAVAPLKSCERPSHPSAGLSTIA